MRKKCSLPKKEVMDQYLKIPDNQITPKFALDMLEQICILECSYLGLPIDIIGTIDDKGFRNRIKVYVSSQEFRALRYLNDEDD